MSDTRLTDAELDALGKDVNWDSRYGERAIEELRELRAAVRQDEIDAAAVVALYAERNALQEQNKKLVAALKAIAKEEREGWPRRPMIKHYYDDAIASAKGEAP